MVIRSAGRADLHPSSAQYLHLPMDLKRWLGTDDTPRWQRTATRFLVGASIAVIVAVLWLMAR